jgi:hypothetical protein
MKKKIVFYLVFFVFLVLPIAYGSGLGVAPAVLTFDDALKGTVTEKQITVQNPGENEIFVSLSVEGEMEDWIKIDKKEGITVPSKGETKIVVKLDPPVDLENGEYSSNLKIVSSVGSSVEGSGMGLLPGVNIDIVATITDEEIVDGEVSKVLTKDEAYGNPIKFIIGFTNKGNIPIGPNVKIEIEKRGFGIVDTIEKDLEAIKSGESKDYEIQWDTNGKEIEVYYRAKVVVSLGDNIIETKENVGFRIFENKNVGPNMGVGILIIVVILVVGFTLFYFTILRK